ncbi:MAG: protein kinase domain-containing protein [Planctomycetaceae bacterium]
MENQPSIHPPEDGFDGSTVHGPGSAAPGVSESSASPSAAPAVGELPASAGSTASVTPIGPPATVSMKFPAGGAEAKAILDDAKTVIRRPDSDSAGKVVRTGAQATPAAVASVLLGTRLNHFLLEELIGGGGMGAVFRARDDRLDRVVAIKVIPFVGEDPDLQRRFRNEAQNAARLDHPYIARVFDVGQFEQWHYIVFEYVDGINLRDMVARDGVLSIDDAVYYARQIAEAIEHANGRGVVHRDIKPSNVLVGVDGNVKVVDMGLARSQQFEVSGDMTASGVTLGTFDYISPEQARDPRDADVRSDIYSLGCTLYYLLTGSPPYPGGTMLQKLLSHGNAPPPDPRGLRPEVSDNLTAIIHKMLAKDPAARYPRAIDVVADLRELAIREGLVRAQSRGTITVASGDPLPRLVLRHVPWMVATVLVIAIAAWLQFSSAISRDQFALPERSPDDVLRLEADVPASPATRAAAGATLSQPNASAAATGGTFAGGNTAAQRPSPRPLGEDIATAPPQFADVARPPINAAPPAQIEPVAPVSTVAVKRIVVGGEMPTDLTVRRTATLVEAVELAEELQVDVIDIASSFITSAPIVVRHDNLTIRSAVGKTEIRFVSGDEPLSMERAAMIDAGSNRITMQDVHLSWNVRGTAIDGGTLFRIASDNPMVRLANATITIENLTERDEVFAFEIDAPEGQTVAARSAILNETTPSTDGESGTSDTTGVSKQEPAKPAADAAERQAVVAIELDNVSARGEMTLISLVDAVPLHFQWQNGLLAVSRRLLETAGADVRPAVSNNQIQIVLERVTAWTPEGLVRMRLGQSRAYPMLVDRKCNRSAFHCGPDASHIEFDGLESAVADPGQLVQLHGEDNAYNFTTSPEAAVLMLRQWDRQWQAFRLADVLTAEKPSWLTDRSLPGVAVRWSKPVPDVTPSRFTTSDFLQDGTLVPGFDENRLPTFPVRSVSDPEI